MYIIFDTETTGLPKDWDAPVSDVNNWPRCIQIAWQIHDEKGKCIEHKDFLVKPVEGDLSYNISPAAEKTHGISRELIEDEGQELAYVLNEFEAALRKSKFVVGHNVEFDLKVMGCEFFREERQDPFEGMPLLDSSTYAVYGQLYDRGIAERKIVPRKGRGPKGANLTLVHEALFGERFGEAHNATADVEATTRVFLELIRIGVINSKFIDSQYKELYLPEELDQYEAEMAEAKALLNEDTLHAFREANATRIEPIGLEHLNLKAASEKAKKKRTAGKSKVDIKANLERLKDAPFAHLHNHTQFSILQATTRIDDMVKMAVNDGQPAVAMTDMGNTMGAFNFVKACIGHNKKVKAAHEEAEKNGETSDMKEIKPIVGCEFFVCKDRTNKKQKDNGYQIVILAKNHNGYKNLIRLVSAAHIEGFYYVPRIDKELLLEYKEDLIVLSGNLNGEIPKQIYEGHDVAAEEALVWWKEHFGKDFYLELSRHNLGEEEGVNNALLALAKKHDVKYVATNDTFYINKENANAHDILLCLKDGEKQSTPKGRGRGFRFGMPNDEFYFKTSDEMKELFKDLPEAIENIQEIVDQIEIYELARDVLLPAFDIPEKFVDPEDEKDGGKRGENAFLRDLTYQGARKRYGEITPDIEERLDFELATIERTGYPGYFLIVQDFTTQARKMGVSVGPGRGSAAGSAVAYCIGITNVDPIKYDLLFERFLNPERVSLPDIDIDFDDEGRGRIIDWVVDKYGSNQVAQIITYGTMAAKSSIRDTARVLDLPLHESDQIAKLVPDIKLGKLFGLDDADLRKKLNADQMIMADQLKEIAAGNDLKAKTLNQARVLEGTMRNTGIHACGVIITPSDIRDHAPMTTAKDSDLLVTQFDNSVVEDAGLLKMDFLGLKTLTLIKEAIRIVKDRHGIEIDSDAIPIDDVKTYELFQRGETVGVFQYESPGMQKHLRALKPNVFSDLIAMNALYRPGPLEYIPAFIRRKHGEEEVVYDLDDMSEYLEETYGITVYQEQVMLLSQKLAGFTKGEADMLRKAMGKKIFALLAKLKPKFINQAMEKGYAEEPLEKIWTDWEAFAAYAFNKSHSTCYAWVAYQTAYLKANYPAEYMASVLSNNMNNIKDVTFFMEECKRMRIPISGPDVNESQHKFIVNSQGVIRCGMGAIKGVGAGAIAAIVKEREENGRFTSIFDLAQRVDLRACNKKAFENLALAGAFDSFAGVHRAQYFFGEKGSTLIEKAIRFGNSYQESKNSAQVSLFGDSSEFALEEPPIMPCEEWSTMEKLNKEREVVGLYISGHPLDDYALELEFYCNSTLAVYANLNEVIGRENTVGGIVTAADHRIAQSGRPWGRFTLEDYNSSHEFALFGEEYLKYRHLFTEGQFLHIKTKIAPPYQRKDGSFTDPRINFLNVQLLGAAKEGQTRKLTLKMELATLTQERLNEVCDLILNYPGENPVAINVFDSEKGVSLSLPSNKYKIDLSSEMVNELRGIDDVTYDLA